MAEEGGGGRPQTGANVCGARGMKAGAASGGGAGEGRGLPAMTRRPPRPRASGPLGLRAGEPGADPRPRGTGRTRGPANGSRRQGRGRPAPWALRLTLGPGVPVVV
ncbi:uncharacterized protein LOC110212993 [Phascolarctos cinereus]